jgi:hypothetical protein
LQSKVIYDSCSGRRNKQGTEGMPTDITEENFPALETETAGEIMQRTL